MIYVAKPTWQVLWNSDVIPYCCMWFVLHMRFKNTKHFVNHSCHACKIGWVEYNKVGQHKNLTIEITWLKPAASFHRGERGLHVWVTWYLCGLKLRHFTSSNQYIFSEIISFIKLWRLQSAHALQQTRAVSTAKTHTHTHTLAPKFLIRSDLETGRTLPNQHKQPQPQSPKRLNSEQRKPAWSRNRHNIKTLVLPDVPGRPDPSKSLGWESPTALPAKAQT